MIRLYKLLAIIVAAWTGMSPLHAGPPVPRVTDLQQESVLAHEQRLPILLTFSSTICSYCDQLEQDFLEPMLLGGDYRDRVLIRKLVVDGRLPITDFDGRRITPGELSDRYRVFVTPTILFIDGNGRELAERMLGINTPELFGGYLDDCIDTALAGVRDPQRHASLQVCRLEHPAHSPDIFKTAKP
jgi:thioredoxin-related protein